MYSTQEKKLVKRNPAFFSNVFVVNVGWVESEKNYPTSSDKFGTIAFSKRFENLYSKAYKYEEKSGAKNPKEIMKMS